MAPEARLILRDRTLSWSRPLLMGVVNANPDSFSDPGPRTPDAIVEQATELVGQGATIIDIGAQSAITGRSPVEETQEAAAVVPAVEAVLDGCAGAIVSVDTYKAGVAEAALRAGAHLVNDVSGLRDVGLARLCATYSAGLVVMHTATSPLTRLQDPTRYVRVAEEVAAFLDARIAAAVAEGVRLESVVVDPGADFAKTPAQTVALLRALDPVVALGRPVLLALSRKDFIGALTGRPPAQRDAGTLGAIAALRHVPGQILRVHDVAAARDLLVVLDVIGGRLEIEDDLALADDLRHERQPRRRTTM